MNLTDFRQTCTECRGTGERYEHGDTTTVKPCETCKGRGKILTHEGDKMMREYAEFMPDFLGDWVTELVDKRVRYETYLNEREVDGN